MTDTTPEDSTPTEDATRNVTFDERAAEADLRIWLHQLPWGKMLAQPEAYHLPRPIRDLLSEAQIAGERNVTKAYELGKALERVEELEALLAAVDDRPLRLEALRLAVGHGTTQVPETALAATYLDFLKGTGA